MVFVWQSLSLTKWRHSVLVKDLEQQLRARERELREASKQMQEADKKNGELCEYNQS